MVLNYTKLNLFNKTIMISYDKKFNFYSTDIKQHNYQQRKVSCHKYIQHQAHSYITAKQWIIHESNDNAVIKQCPHTCNCSFRAPSSLFSFSSLAFFSASMFCCNRLLTCFYTSDKTLQNQVKYYYCHHLHYYLIMATVGKVLFLVPCINRFILYNDFCQSTFL